ncbi:MAG: HD domain-containing protein [Armatimonadetes bacterium]|nr:HD domain-containing protein [Armatimonadota bacterium]
MARKLVKDLREGDAVTGSFAVRQKRLLPFRNKSGNYLDLLLADRSGEISARMWDRADEAADLFDVGDVVIISGHVESYNDRLQIIIKSVRKASEDEYDEADFLASGKLDLEDATRRLLQWITSVQQPDLRLLLESLFGDRELLDWFIRCPGSKSLHHAHLGGLLEHTLGVLSILAAVCESHPELDRDLLIAGGLLHDLGKTQELQIIGTTIEYTDLGRLVGHIVLTDRMVTEHLRGLPDFPEELAARLTHLLLSHHGQKEYGAPVLPMTPEACALHYADNLDAHVQYFGEVVESGPPGNRWSEYQRLFDRYIYLGDRKAEEDKEDGQ